MSAGLLEQEPAVCGRFVKIQSLFEMGALPKLGVLFSRKYSTTIPPLAQAPLVWRCLNWSGMESLRQLPRRGIHCGTFISSWGKAVVT